MVDNGGEALLGASGSEQSQVSPSEEHMKPQPPTGSRTQVETEAAILGGSPLDLDNARAYAAWREAKLAAYPRSAADLRIPVGDLAQPTEQERAAIVATCRRSGMALHASARRATATAADEGPRETLMAFAAAFGLGPVEDHRSAATDGLVAIEVSSQPSKKGFIPYSTRPLSWHTDGYYNPPDQPIRSMVLHCVRPAAEGGDSALLDPAIAYIRLRDRSPALIAALMHPEAMLIPESVEEDGRVRPTSVGPVFLIEPGGQGLTMRYSARTRNIAWRDDADTAAARKLLEALLTHGEEPLVIRHTLAAGEGLICNNVLHMRTGFTDGETRRLLLRARYRQRIAGT